MINLKHPLVIDVSVWENIQSVAHISPRPWMIIPKATEGLHIIDPTFSRVYVQTKEIGARRASFHFMTLDNPEQQAEFYVGVVRQTGLDQGDILVCDFEDRAISLAAVKKFNDHVQALTGFRPWIYSTQLLLEEQYVNGVCPEWLKNEVLWIAEYPSEATINATTTFPDFVVPKGCSKDNVVLWQYTDDAVIVGCDGETDANMINPIWITKLGLKEPTGTVSEHEIVDKAVRYIGRVKPTITPHANIRSTPGGMDVGNVPSGTPIKGAGELVSLGVYDWMYIVEINGQPAAGWMATSSLEYQEVVPEPTPEPEPTPGEPMQEQHHIGTCIVRSGVVRDTPNGNDTLKRIVLNQSIKGMGPIVTAGAYKWMYVTEAAGLPINGWVATVNLKYTTTFVDVPSPVQGNMVTVSFSLAPGYKLMNAVEQDGLVIIVMGAQ